jgi:preprotein translocase subunit SecA
MQASHINPLTGEEEMDQPLQATPQLRSSGPVDPNNPATWGKVQRNSPCPCGSGRKFKHCHGALVTPRA